VYSRFSLRSVTYAEAERLWDNLEKIVATRWVFMLEARTCYDELYGVDEPVGLHEFKTDHYRRFLDPVVILSQLFRLHRGRANTRGGRCAGGTGSCSNGW